MKRIFPGIRRLCFLLSILMLLLSAIPVFALSDTAAPQMPAASEELSMTPVRAVTKIRTIPASDAIIIGCLEDGAVLTVLGDAGAYYQIDCFDMTGYICKEQVALDEAGTYRVRCNPNCSETTYFTNNTATQALSLTGQLRNTALAYIGVPYVTGGTSARGFDCSGLTQYVFASAGYPLMRTVSQQLQSGIIIPKEDLQCGDLVFFKYTTSVGSLYSHVGIYIGNGQILHASSTRGVTINDLSEPYYTEHYLCARRVVLSDISGINTIPSVNGAQNFNSSYWRENSRTESSGSFD
ncbi:MAG: C40 family peptidase [Oscillospiraceae bacterium]|nr:C40 family peptidase [Oscillospiraceae bacterium]